ncbi:MAG: hypothetical protein ABEL76_12575 [Bradymonadaceae bacterium]
MHNTRPPVALRSIATAVAVLIALVSTGCAGQGLEQRDRSVDRPNDLQVRLRNFHRYMRWENFRRAASLVHKSHRQKFIGHYVEAPHGFDILGLDVKLVETPGQGKRLVEVHQRWVVEPQMQVREQRYIELWKKSTGGWKLFERVAKSEWRSTGSGK